MKIRVKYCGGCNCGYDRTKFLRDLLSYLNQELQEDIEVVYEEEGTFDVGLIICGCPACCADRTEVRKGTENWHVVSAGLLDYLEVPQSEIPVMLGQLIKSAREKATK
ncbi:MAG: Uncharacterized protein XD63_0738 [Thermoanaerobacterales bacterium 50_218]|nr:MAG: Uncharacterized protein XD63_0738 [Thermoanaerobacterales bacterium 50_218]HAA90174.1 hypothetical protein [Peptococcaceae bacterium]